MTLQVRFPLQRKQQRIGLISNRINGSVFFANFFEKSIWTVLWEKCKFCQVLSGSGYGILVYIHRGSSNAPINWDTNSGKEQIRKIYPDRFLKSFVEVLSEFSWGHPIFIRIGIRIRGFRAILNLGYELENVRIHFRSACSELRA